MNMFVILCIKDLREGIIYKRINNFFMNHNLFYDNQFGFRKNHSTELAAEYLISKIKNAMNNK